MKKGLIRFTVFALPLILIVLFSGCSILESPMEAFNEYIQAWQEQDYKTMYINISSQDKELISEEDFTNAYKEFYDAMNVQSINIKQSVDEEELQNKVKNDESISLPLNIDIETEYGEKSYDLDINFVKEEDAGKELWRIKWDYNMIYKGMAEGDTIQVAYTDLPVRGEVLDRNGKRLAQNGVAIQVGIVPGRLGDMKDEVINDLSETFDISEEYINDRLGLSWVKDDTFVDLKEIPEEDLPLIEAIHAKNNGATYKEVNERIYPYKDIIAHLVGYIGYMNEEELNNLSSYGFTGNDKVGKTGLEKVFDESLRGKPGVRVAIVDKENVEKEVLFESEVINGEDLQLSIDIDLQAKLYSQLKGEQGTAAVTNYETGDVLALVSLPSYDPNRFILGINADELNNLQEAEGEPLLNRFTNVYSPGSTLKPITAAIALNENAIDESFTIDVDGLEWQKDSTWGNYFVTRVKDPEVPVDLEKAMIYSDNIYFAQVALKIGAETFIEKAKDFGIGEELNLRYGVKDSQLATGDKISSEVLLADTGYGQGEVLLNILNLNKAYSAFVNDGNIIDPKLIVDGAEANITNAVTKEVADRVFDLTLKVVEDEKGTGHGAYIPGKVVAGKTGTAEVPSGVEGELDELGWFVATDKGDTTPYITTIMIENVKDRGGSHVAIDKVRNFIQDYSLNN